MQSPKIKNRRISILVMIVLLLGVTINHLRVESTENGPMLIVDEKKVDILGELNNQWVSITTDCSQTVSLPLKDLHEHGAIRALKAYSPPQSEKAHVTGVWQLGEWFLVESEFDELFPSVVLIKKSANEFQIVPQALWSGYTRPWKAAPFIRQYISKQAPQVPMALINCYKPESKYFQ